MENRIPVVTVEFIEVASSAWIAIEGGLEISRDRHFALRCIGALPSAIEFGLLDLPHPGGPHATELDQSERPTRGIAALAVAAPTLQLLVIDPRVRDGAMIQ